MVGPKCRPVPFHVQSITLYTIIPRALEMEATPRLTVIHIFTKTQVNLKVLGG